MKRGRLIIAIDGPAAAGKSTAGKRLAAALGYLYLDSGALYRTAALQALREGIPLEDGRALEEMISRSRLEPRRGEMGMRMLLDGEDVTEAIRGEKAGFAASRVSTLPEVRRALLRLQREVASDGGVVMDGRDIGTVVFPEAEAKFYLDASPEERGRRRCEEMKAAGRPCDLASVVEDIRRRDFQDSNRAHAPLRRAPDAFYVDTTRTTPEEVLELLLARVRELEGKEA